MTQLILVAAGIALNNGIIQILANTEFLSRFKTCNTSNKSVLSEP